jgi:NAD kinase
MSQDRRSCEQISPTEYLEVFLSNPGEITVLSRKDHGSYWLLSREMFKDVPVAGVNTNRLGSFSESEVDRVAEALRNQIDSTRYLLGQRLAAR